MRLKRLTRPQTIASFIAILLLAFGLGVWLPLGQAAKLPNRSLTLTNPKQGEASSYVFRFDLPATSTVGSITFQFCSDTPIIDLPCTPPTGLDVSSASLTSQTGATGFSIDSSSDANNLVLTRLPLAAGPGTVSYSFSNVQNPTAVGTYYARIKTFASNDGSGAYADAAGLAYVINNAISITSTVPPYLLFCNGTTIQAYDCSTTSGSYLNFGELSSLATKSGTMQMVLATNAGGGYNVYVDGTTMTAGNSAISPLLPSDVSRPGVSQFGLNLAANSTPAVGAVASGPGAGAVQAAYSNPDHYRFAPGERLIASAGVSDYRKFTVSYIVNIARDQPPGIYVTTLTYVAVASF